MTHFGVAGARARPADLTASTLPGLLSARAAAHPAAVAFEHQRHGVWRRLTWREVERDVAALAGALAAHGVRPGETVLVAGPNGPRLTVGVLAAQWLGALPALVPQSGTGAALAEVAAATQARVALVAGVHEVEALRDIMPARVVYDDPTGLRGRRHASLMAWDAFAAGAAPIPPSPDDIAVVLHAAGDGARLTTLDLTHADLIEAAGAVPDVDASDRLFAALPFGWGEPLVFGPVLSLLSGAVLGFAENDTTLLADWRAFGPTVISGPAALLAKFRARIAEDAPRVGWPWRQRLSRSLGLAPNAPIVGPVARLLIVATRDRLGLARTRLALVHGAVPPELIRFCGGLGVRIERPALPRRVGVTEQVQALALAA